VVPPPIGRGRTIARRERVGILTSSSDGRAPARGVAAIRDAVALRSGTRQPVDHAPQRAGADRQADLGQLGRRLGRRPEELTAA
jgi:hypothetical protein